MLKAIFFDAVGTLIYLPKSVGEHYREIALHHGADLPVDELNRAFRAQWAASPPRLPSDGPRPDDDKGWWQYLVTHVLDATLPPDAHAGFNLEAFFEELYAHFAAPGVWAAYPETAGVLRELHSRGLQLGVISNFDRRLYPVLDSLGLREWLDAVIVSSEIGVEKPDPRIFRQALDALGVSAPEALHVGDEPTDWGAETVGVRVLRLHRPEMTLHDVIPIAQEGLQRAAS